MPNLPQDWTHVSIIDTGYAGVTGAPSHRILSHLPVLLAGKIPQLLRGAGLHDIPIITAAHHWHVTRVSGISESEKF